MSALFEFSDANKLFLRFKKNIWKQIPSIWENKRKPSSQAIIRFIFYSLSTEYSVKKNIFNFLLISFSKSVLIKMKIFAIIHIPLNIRNMHFPRFLVSFISLIGVKLILIITRKLLRKLHVHSLKLLNKLYIFCMLFSVVY